jgi:dipeptidyl aminopeptidase/acylaminoacyl peptidase
MLDLNKLLSMPSFNAVRISPSGNKIAYLDDISGRLELYIRNLENNEVRKVTDGNLPRQIRANYIWSYDSTKIIFCKDDHGNEMQKLVLLDVETLDTTPIECLPNSSNYPIEDMGNLNLLVNVSVGNRMSVFIYNPHGPNTWREVNSENGNLHCIGLNKSQTKIATTYRDEFGGSSISIIEISSAERRTISFAKGSNDVAVFWNPCYDSIAISTNMLGRKDVVIYNLSEETTLLIEPSSPDAELYFSRFSKSGEHATIIESRESKLSSFVFDIKNNARIAIPIEADSIQALDFILNDSSVLAIKSNSNTKPSLITFNLSNYDSMILIPDRYGEVDSTTLIKGEHIYYSSSDEEMVPAIIYKPTNTATKVPALIYVHGGPTTQFWCDFNLYAQFFVTLGLCVLMPNYRGSTGYGNRWRELNKYDYGGGDLEDIINGARYLKTLSFIDEDRIAILGSSFGGFIAYAIAVGAYRDFKLSVAIGGFTDLPALHTENSSTMPSLAYYLEEMMGNPSKNKELWKERSPINNIGEQITKLLIIHGVNDPRCSIWQARNFRQKLLESEFIDGIDFDYYELEDEGHGPAGDIESKIRTYGIVKDFLLGNL